KQENRTIWTVENVEESVRMLLLENNTNFKDLIKNLENHQDLYDLVFRIVVDGERITFNPDNATISKGILYGVFKRNGSIKIHNRLYEQRIYNYMISNIEVNLQTENYNDNNQFKLPNNELNLQKVIEKFQEFLKEEYSGQDQSFLERQWRIIFLAFLRPILNGSGYTFKEVQISEEKRLDVTITYFQHQYIVELKRWYGNAAHERGIVQLSDYLDRQNQTKGYLVIFEHKTGKTWRKERIEYEDKEIFAVWV
ncbi:MAG: AAA family ATPase, partial [Saprospiraceae bacterium]